MQQAKTLEYLKAGNNVFLTGPAGSGKTYVLIEFIDWLRKNKKKVAVTASTGIAATHLGGTTIHSWSGIGIADQLSDWQLDAMMQKEHLHKRFKNTDVLIIDEISMFDAPRLDIVDKVLRKIRDNYKPFGGMQIVLSGDFFQLPPITRNNAPAQFAFESKVWQEMDDLVVCYLDLVFRQSDDPLLNILNEIRGGDLNDGTIEALKERLDEALPDHVTATHLYTHNVDVDKLNLDKLKLLTGKEERFQMTSSGKPTQVEMLKKYCLAPELLQLKPGAAVMFVKNNFSAGYANGTLGTVVDFEYGSVIVETADGKRITVGTETWAIEQDKQSAEITQIPLRLAWAITVHKSQGMTLDTIEVDLSKSFAPGMGYVALSRVRSLSGLYLRGMNQHALVVEPRIQDKDKQFRAQSQRFE